MSYKKIHVIITGGTIDSAWDPAHNTAVIGGGNSSVPSYFKKLNPDIELIFTIACLKDSRELVPEDLKRICTVVDSSSDDKFLITHGTYTMPDTARYLRANMKTDKAVILTGSMIPLRGFEMSDAGFNLGFAFANLLNMDKGIFLAMHGRLFTPEEVAKNMSEARFFSVKQ